MVSSVSFFSCLLKSLKGTSECGTGLGTGSSASHAGVTVSPRPPCSRVPRAAGSTGAARQRCCGCGRRAGARLGGWGPAGARAAHSQSAGSRSLLQVHARQSLPAPRSLLDPRAPPSVHFSHLERGRSRPAGKSGGPGRAGVCAHPPRESHLLAAKADASPAPRPASPL